MLGIYVSVVMIEVHVKHASVFSFLQIKGQNNVGSFQTKWDIRQSGTTKLYSTLKTDCWYNTSGLITLRSSF